MSKRHVDPRHREYEGALRSALHMAVDSLDPGADGLDQIRAKIAAKPSARRRLGWWTTAVPGDARSWWRVLLPPRGWFPAVVDAVVERFRPDPSRAGWFGWLRPAAAVTTGLFVVSAASWAVAALPSVISPPKLNPHHVTSPATKDRTSATHRQTYSSTGGISPNGNPSSGYTGPSTPTCSSTASISPSTAPSGSTPSTVSPPSSSSTSLTVTPPSSSATTPIANTPSIPPQVSVTPWASSGQAIASAPASSAVPADSPEATGKALLSPGAMAATKLAEASGVRAAVMFIDDDPPTPTNTPQQAASPTASPTVGSPAPPYPTSSPPLPPC